MVTRVVDSTRVVTVSMTTGSGALSGTLTKTAVAGVADFSGQGLSINLVRSEERRVGKDRGGVITSSTTSPAVTITFAAANKLVVTTQPSASTVAGVAFAQQPVVQFQESC